LAALWGCFDVICRLGVGCFDLIGRFVGML